MPQIPSATWPTFDYPKFLSLSGSAVVAYMEPLLNDPALVVGPEDLRRLAAALPSFDEYHLVYAIEVGTDSLPSLFALPVARCLTHRDQSVRLAAHRALSRLPAHAITEALVNATRAAVAAGAPAAEVGDLPDVLARRQAVDPVDAAG